MEFLKRIMADISAVVHNCRPSDEQIRSIRSILSRYEKIHKEPYNRVWKQADPESIPSGFRISPSTYPKKVCPRCGERGYQEDEYEENDVDRKYFICEECGLEWWEEFRFSQWFVYESTQEML
jgi:DNA-directed RNA polymerase subunit M/transcription elongation factor TFIIS